MLDDVSARLGGDEFVATEPGQRVAFTQRGLQALRQRDQELVADLVAAGIVDGLEAVQVEVGDRQQMSVPLGLDHGQVQPVGQQYPVGQAGEHVVVRHPFELSFDPLAHVDVGNQADESQFLAFGVVEALSGEVPPEFGTIGAPVQPVHVHRIERARKQRLHFPVARLAFGGVDQ